ncbi:WD40 repeat domain-containing protein [Endozoicomonas euniceicola]|uniref:WD40 repeat domain-containing protein n=1 Tax=Endozoicomonas euniceicola TaxID=1234143 RepID=A0ABY6GVU2_9GAMM|nr:WD40 repeat domain-containing protein [Endozoicomonas euniceicola]UYM16885.1 WD40 repeat domain-containing protein [Endozoicomonas euniceicola]
MKTIKLLVINQLLLLLAVAFFLPMTGYGSAFFILPGWMGYGSAFSILPEWMWRDSPSNKAAVKISQIVLARDAPSLLFSYEINKTSSDFVQPEKNQVYTRWDGCKNDSLRICFRRAAKVFAGGYSYPPTISGSTELNVEMGEVTPDEGGWQSVASVRLTGKGSGWLAIAGDDGWRIAPDCSGIDSDDSSVLNRSEKPSVDLVVPTALVLEKGNNAEDHGSPYSRRSLPDISDITKQNNLPGDRDDLLTGSSGGGSFDDHDDSFKRRPGGNDRRPLFFFEVMSRMLGAAVSVFGTAGQPGEVKKLVLRPQIILVTWRGWERQEIPVTSQMWGSIKRAGLDRDPGLFLALAESDPDKLKETLENYSKKHSPLADVLSYHCEDLNLDPKAGNARLLSVSVFPGFCPSGVGCSGGEKEANGAMNDLPRNNPDGYAHNNHGQPVKSFGNNGGGGDGSGNPEINSCTLCGNAQVNSNGLCTNCLMAKQEAAEEKPSTHLSLPAAQEDKGNNLLTALINGITWFFGRATNQSANQAEEKTAEDVSVNTLKEVSTLQTLPPEILFEIAKGLSWRDVNNWSLAAKRFFEVFYTFNIKEKLTKLSHQYYGSAAKAYRKMIKNMDIPAVPNSEIDDPLLRLAYRRTASNKYLTSLGNSTEQQCVATLKGHTHTATSVTSLADGRLASASDDCTVKVWDLSKPPGKECVVTLKGHTHDVISVTPLADGRLASASADNTVKVWDLSKPDGQQCVATLEGHTFWVASVTPLADGRLASASWDNTVRVWDLSKPPGKECVATLYGHTYIVSSVTALADGRLASGSLDETVKVWDLSKTDRPQCVVTLKWHTNSVISVTPLADGRLASASADNTVKVWGQSKINGEQFVVTLEGHNEVVYSVTQLADGRLASASQDETVKVWDLSKRNGKQCVVTLEGHTDWVKSVTPLADGRLASASRDKTIKVWVLSKGSETK